MPGYRFYFQRQMMMSSHCFVYYSYMKNKDFPMAFKQDPIF